MYDIEPRADQLFCVFQSPDADEAPAEGRSEGSQSAEEEGRCSPAALPDHPRQDCRGTAQVAGSAVLGTFSVINGHQASSWL